MRENIDRITRAVLVFMMGILVVNVVWQVFSRYILDAPSIFTDELARFLLIWISLIGAAYYSGKNIHISIDVLPQRLRAAGRRRLHLFVNALIIAFALCVLVIGGGALVYHTYVYTQLTPTLQVPMAFVYLVGPISGLLVIYYKLSDMKNMLASASEQPDAPPS